MDVYNSEDEQLAAFKRWWKANGTSIVLGSVLGVAIIGGWNLWQDKQRRAAEQASALYQQALLAVKESRSDTALELGERLARDYGDSAYGTYGLILLSRIKVERADTLGAKHALEGVLNSRADDNYKHIARLRLVELLLSGAELDAARARLDEVEKSTAGLGAFQSQYEELRGDVLAAQGDTAAAHAAYTRAKGPAAFSVLLDMKRDALGQVEASSMQVAPPASNAKSP